MIGGKLFGLPPGFAKPAELIGSVFFVNAKGEGNVALTKINAKDAMKFRAEVDRHPWLSAAVAGNEFSTPSIAESPPDEFGTPEIVVEEKGTWDLVGFDTCVNIVLPCWLLLRHSEESGSFITFLKDGTCFAHKSCPKLKHALSSFDLPKGFAVVWGDWRDRAATVRGSCGSVAEGGQFSVPLFGPHAKRHRE